MSKSKEVDPEQWEVVSRSIVRALAKIPTIVKAAEGVARDPEQAEKLTALQAFLIGGIIGAS